MKQKNLKTKKGGKLKWIVIAIIAVAVIGSALGDDAEKDSASSAKKTTESTSKPKKDVPAEYVSALNKAEAYGSTMNMSKQGIYDQLVSEHGEKFSKKAANYAMKNLKIDWNKNALAKAKDYSDTMYMSKQGIYDQLTSQNGEKFTAKQAKYAIKHIKANWKENALKKAKDYQDTMDMSPAAIRDQLTSQHGEKFTKEEADYAIKNL